jgi:hypothetical protein
MNGMIFPMADDFSYEGARNAVHLVAHSTSYSLYIIEGGTSWSLEPDKNNDGVAIFRILFNESNCNE